MSEFISYLLEDHAADGRRSGEGAAVELNDGSLLLIYGQFDGSFDASPAKLVSRRSADGGLSWTEPDIFLEPEPGWVNLMSVSLLRLHNGSIGCAFLAKPDPESCVPYWTVSVDDGQTWSTPRPLVTTGHYVVAGGQHGLLFSPDMWRELIYPYHKTTCDAVRGRGAYLSLHSDGNVTQILDGIIELGYQVMHPYQESAGMDFQLYLNRYRNKFTVMGGLDIQTTLGFGRLDLLKSEIQRIVGLFPDRRLLLCTTHYVQEHCSIEELVYAFDLITELTR